MKTLLILLSLSAIASAEEITTQFGKKIIGTVSRVEPNGIVLETDSGIEKVPFADLTAVDQKRFGYDPAKAATFAVESQKAAVQRIARDKAAVRTEAKHTAEMRGGVQQFVKLNVATLAKNPFSLKGAMVELAGIKRINIQEVSAGVYEATIWGDDFKYLKARLPYDKTKLVERSETLFISISEPAENGTKVVIHGNASGHRQLNNKPIAYWTE